MKFFLLIPLVFISVVQCSKKNKSSDSGFPSQPSCQYSSNACVIGSGSCSFDDSFLGETFTSLTSIPDSTDACNAIYYVSNTGNDANNGTSEETPWQTIEKVNATSFSPGNCVLFKRGDEWVGTTLQFLGSGTEGSPILAGAYGSGDKPVISGKLSIPSWNTSGNWSAYSATIWRMNISDDPWRMWLSQVEYVKAEALSTISSYYRWYYDSNNQLLYVYATSNPASFYNNMEWAGASGATVGNAGTAGQSYITLRNLDIRGGFASLSIYGSDYIIVEGCNIGQDATMGVFVAAKTWDPTKDSSNNGIIRHNYIDSGYRLTFTYEMGGTEDGIHLRNCSNSWEIYGNEIIAWGHTGISLWADTESSGWTVSNNRIYSNFITTIDIPYGRGFSTQGRSSVNGNSSGICKNNEFYYNVVRDTKAPIQIGGDYNLVYKNVIDTVKISLVKPLTTGRGIILTPAGDIGYVSNYNEIYDNIIYKTDEAGIEIQDWHQNYSIQNNQVRNNIIVNGGGASQAVEWSGITCRSNAGIVVGDNWPQSQYAITGKNNRIENNIVYKNDTTFVAYYRGLTACITAFNDKNGTYGDIISNNVQLDPLLTDPENHNFYLQENSPCNN